MSNLTPGNEWENVLSHLCDKCGRWYSHKTPHICFPDDINIDDERRKLKRWLGDGAKLVQ